MNFKNFLLAAVALAVIGAGGSISMYYQMLRVEHAKKRELSDQYYSNQFYRNYQGALIINQV